MASISPKRLFPMSAHCVVTAVLMLLVAGCGSSGFEWHDGALGKIYMNEVGRPITMRIVEIRRTTSPFESWLQVLVQIREEGESANVGGDLPLWPARQGRIDQDLLRRIYWESPGYRCVKPLLSNARYLNREIGTFKTCYVIGNHPLVVAIVDEDSKPTTTFRSVESNTLGPSITTRKTNDPRIPDGRQRYVEFVSDRDLHRDAVAVLRFPDEMVINRDFGVTPRPESQSILAEYIGFRTPQRIGDILKLVGEPAMLLQLGEVTMIEVRSF